MSRIFISHATSDRQFVNDKLVGLVSAVGFDPWIAENDIESAEEWERSIKSGLESSDCVLILISQAAIRSQWVKAEVAWAVQNRWGRILPVRIDNSDATEINLLIPQLQILDYADDSTRPHEKLVQSLVKFRVWRRISAIDGKWKGEATQDEGPDGRPLKNKVEATLTANHDRIVGDFRTTVHDDGIDITIDYSLSGTFQYDSFVQLDYVSKNPASMQFGSVILELDPSGISFSGKFVGYAAISRGIVGGCVSMEKDTA